MIGKYKNNIKTIHPANYILDLFLEIESPKFLNHLISNIV